MNLTKVKYELSNGIASITMNDPDSLNVLDEIMQKDLMQCFTTCEYNPDVKVVILQAEGRTFSGGGDIKSMLRELEKTPKNNALLDEGFSWPGIIAKQIRSIKKPVIASIQGAVAGAAANITLMCDFRIASEDLVFTEAFIKIGLITDGGGVYVLNKLLGAARTTELVMTGRPVKAEEALQIGLVTEVVPNDQLRNRTWEYAQKLKSGAPKAYQYMKTLINQAAFADLGGYLEVETELQKTCSYTKDFLEGTKAFVEKRTPIYKGH